MRSAFVLAWLGGWLVLAVFPGIGRFIAPLLLWVLPLTIFALAVSRLVGWLRS